MGAVGIQGYLGIAVVEVGGQEAVGEVAFDEAGRCQFLWRAEKGGGQRRTRRLSDGPWALWVLGRVRTSTPAPETSPQDMTPSPAQAGPWGTDEPDTGTHSLSLSIPARVCSEDTRAGCSLERPRAAAGRAMKGHRGNRSSGRRAAGLCSGLSAGRPAAPCHARPLHQPALRPQALTQGSPPTGPSPSMLLLSRGATLRPPGPSLFLSCGL